MLVALWIVNVLLALAFLGSGGMKLARSKADLQKAGMGWTENYPAAAVKLIGAAEVAGAIGLILPLATDIAPVLTPVAAVCLFVVMVGAVVTHLRRKERAYLGPLVLGILSVASAVLGFLVVL
jgi:uncharacterized membrane protein YphA (DoxX/SURF4 family)